MNKKTNAWSGDIGREIAKAKAKALRSAGGGLPLTIWLPMALTNGNDGRGNKWFSSAKVRKEIEVLLRGMGYQREPFESPVDIHITRVLGPRQKLWDADSLLRGNSKELIDAIVAVGFLVDDGPKYVKTVTADQDENDRENGPAIELTFSAADQT